MMDWLKIVLNCMGFVSRKSTKKELKTLQKNNIRLNSIGDLSKLPSPIIKELDEVIEKTRERYVAAYEQLTGKKFD